MKVSYCIFLWILSLMIAIRFYTELQGRVRISSLLASDYAALIIVPALLIASTTLLGYRLFKRRRPY